jgi:hypothetical protein
MESEAEFRVLDGNVKALTKIRCTELGILGAGNVCDRLPY